VRLLGEHDEMAPDALGNRIRVDYAPGGEHGCEWFRGLVDDLADDALVQADGGAVVVSLRR
jgi:A/G-specific adenine glycosylase